LSLPARKVSYSELHRLGTGGTKLSRYDNLATLGSALHDKAQHTITRPPDSETVKELVAERLALSDGGETTVLDLRGIERHAVLGELEALLDQRGELTDAAALLSKNFLGVCCTDDDVGDGRGDADFDARVALLGELALEELVELGVENTICDELSALGAVNGALVPVRRVFRGLRVSKGRTLHQLERRP